MHHTVRSKVNKRCLVCAAKPLIKMINIILKYSFASTHERPSIEHDVYQSKWNTVLHVSALLSSSYMAVANFLKILYANIDHLELSITIFYFTLNVLMFASFVTLITVSKHVSSFYTVSSITLDYFARKQWPLLSESQFKTLQKLSTALAIFNATYLVCFIIIVTADILIFNLTNITNKLMLAFAFYLYSAFFSHLFYLLYFGKLFTDNAASHLTRHMGGVMKQRFPSKRNEIMTNLQIISRLFQLVQGFAIYCMKYLQSILILLVPTVTAVFVDFADIVAEGLKIFLVHNTINVDCLRDFLIIFVVSISCIIVACYVCYFTGIFSNEVKFKLRLYVRLLAAGNLTLIYL